MRKRVSIARAAALALIALWIYWPALHGDWVWDDHEEIASNPQVRDPRGWGPLWTHPLGRDYFPVKSSVQWLQWRAWDSNRLGYHLTNVGLHWLSALLIAVILEKLARGRLPGFGWIGAALFVVHPMAVESVAWIAEMKNALSLPLLLGAFLAWMADAERRRSRDLGAVFVLFSLSLLTKTSGVLFPIVALAYSRWRRGRLERRDWFAGAALLAVALAAGVVTVVFQQHRAIQGEDLGMGTWESRLASAGCAIWFYLGKFLFPLRVTPIYDWPARWHSAAWGLAAWGALALAVVGLIARRTEAACAALFGLAWFGLNLLPVLGIIPMAFLRLSWVADHLAYLPMVGLVGLAAAALSAALKRLRAQAPRAAGAAFVAVLALGTLLAVRSRTYAAAYRSSESLWQYAIRENPRAWLAYNNLGETWLDDPRRWPDAIAAEREALRLKPDLPEAHLNLGLALGRTGHTDEAERELREALRLRPRYPEASRDLGLVLAGEGRTDEALADYREALRWRPFYPDTRRELASLLAASGRAAEAEREFEQAIRFAPHDAATRFAYASALNRMPDRRDDAQRQYEAAIELDPGMPEAHNDLGVLLAKKGRYAEARAQWEAAMRLRPGYRDAERNLNQLKTLGY
ncbi:MAG TPA: tetratricopeptide repeat protein [Opitutaceae bacterium]|jgi:tetratricopeptide (TPR) repeat protein